MKKIFFAAIPIFVFSTAYADICPANYGGLSFEAVGISAIFNEGVSCFYGHSAQARQILKIGFESQFDNYEASYGPWKISAPRYYKCTSTTNSDCAFRKVD